VAGDGGEECSGGCRIVKDNNGFLRDLSASRMAVNEFAARLRDKGWQIWLPPEFVRPDATVRHDYSDQGDIMVQGRVEHKVRTNLHFTCREDYPYDTVIVDEAYKEDAKASDPVLAYIIENSSRTHAAVVYGWKRHLWQIERRRDPIQRRDCDFYTIHKDHVRFCHPADAF
jgi:hypothetical protein